MIQIYKEQKENIEARLIGIKNGAPKVIKNAINKAVDSAKNDMVNKVKETYTIKSKNAITKTIKISKANIKNLTATITSRGVAVPLIDFNVKPSKPLKGKNRPYLYVQVKKGEGGIIKRAFITKGKTTGKIGIYERVGNARYPISQKYGPSVPAMVGSRNVRLYVETNARKVLTQLIEEEIEKLIEER